VVSELPMISIRKVKELIKDLILSDPDVTLDEIMHELHQRHIDLTRLAVSYIRSEFRETLEFLMRKGLVKPIIPGPSWERDQSSNR
jgi:hypothetical protein